MCIIAYSPMGMKINKSILKRCFRIHRDGAGIMVRDEDGFVAFSKGLMTFSQFYLEYRDILQQYPGCEYAVHFRTGTSGEDDLGCTHPFPITDDEDELLRLVGYSDQAMMHNGIVGKGDGYFSDTQCYVRDYLYPLQNLLEIPSVQEMIGKHIGSYNKFLIMGIKDTHMIGDWIEDKGFYYSNYDFEDIGHLLKWDRDYVLDYDIHKNEGIMI